jgi:hypothetical protein
MQYSFGAGLLWGTQQQDANGNPVSNATPVMFGTVQEVSLDVTFEQKELYGSNSQFPLAIGNGKAKISGKAKLGSLNGDVLSNLFFGQSSNYGLTSVNYDTIGTLVPASTPYTITVTPPNSGTYGHDLGVINASTGIALEKVASTPAANQYSESAGVYTFNAAQTGVLMYINYSYTATSNTAKSSTVLTKPMGYSPNFQMDLYIPYNGQSFVVTLYKCISNKFSLQTKLDDFNYPEIDFTAFANSSGQVLTWALAE